jgi:alcohol dehydrogenase
VDINEETLAFAKQLGAMATVNATQSADVVGEIKALTKGGAHVSMDALGSQTTCFNSIANLRKRGKHIQVGLMTGNHQHPKVPMDQVLANELEIIGSHGMQAFKYPEMLDMIKNGILHPEKLIDKTITLQEATIALPNMNKFEHKGVLVINSL